MKRRDFLGAIAIATTGLNIASCRNDSNANSESSTVINELENHTGAVTLYYEFRLAGPERANMLAAFDALSANLSVQTGFLNMTLKNIVGDSTMVKNYPANLKGVLASAYKEGFAAQSMPLFYSLFIRFENYTQLKATGVQNWFTQTIEPMLHIYQVQNGAAVKTAIAFDYYEGYFKSVAAGDRNAIYKDEASIQNFLKNQQDKPSSQYKTVENHVSIHAVKTDEFNQKVIALLTTAQTTFRPALDDTDFNAALDPNLIGQAGSPDASNTYYRKAVTTEILQSLSVMGEQRDYLMHGVWESVWDHENSHLDPRFKQSSMSVGVYVVAGPVEPFYETHRLVNAN